MGENDSNLTTRYYTAEVFIWLLGVILVFARFLGLAPDQEMPGLGIKIADTFSYFRALSCLQVATVFYLIFEWKASNTTARNVSHSKIRLAGTLTWVIVSLWLGYPLITQGTSYNACSPAWFLAFVVLGLAIENFLSVLILAALTIRSREEARMHGFPRVPAAAGAQFWVSVPILCFLLIVYFFLWHNAPVPIALIAPYLTGLIFFLSFGHSAISLCNGRDENGKRLTFRQNVVRFRELHDRHDYWRMVADLHVKIEKVFGRERPSQLKDCRKRVQEIRDRLFPGKPEQWFRVLPLEGLEISMVPSGLNPDKKGVITGVKSIQISSGILNKETLLVRVLHPPPRKSEEISIPIHKVNQYANTFVRDANGSIKLGEMLLYSFQFTVLLELCKTMPFSLHKMSFAGAVGIIKELLEGGADVNEQGTGGWTPLLSAVAEGKRDVAKILLEAGANPDLVNANDITPLIYAARYGDLPMCKLLLRYKANFDMQDIWGNTALMKAILVGSEEVAVYLLECGASLTPKNKNGFDALQIAYGVKKGELARLIKQKLEEGRIKR